MVPGGEAAGAAARGAAGVRSRPEADRPPRFGQVHLRWDAHVYSAACAWLIAPSVAIAGPSHGPRRGELKGWYDFRRTCFLVLSASSTPRPFACTPGAMTDLAERDLLTTKSSEFPPTADTLRSAVITYILWSFRLLRAITFVESVGS